MNGSVEPIGASPEDAYSYVARVNQLLDRRRVDSARDILRDALAHHPTDASLLLAAARTEMLGDDNAQALTFLRSLLHQDPKHHTGRFLLFCIELDEGRLQQAEGIILELLRESPSEASYYAYYARLMLRALDFKKASQLADESVRLAPNEEECLHVKALCDIADGRAGPNSPSLIRLLGQNPDDARTLRLVVVALVHAKRSKDALRLAQELFRAQPNDPSMLNLVKALKLDNHWSLWPLWPVRRWGYAGSAGLWFGMLGISHVLGLLAPAYRGAFLAGWLVFVVYSWAWPPLLQRLQQRST